MNKKQALQIFNQNWREFVKSNPEWKNDTIAKREDWNIYTDMLCKDGQITENQYNTWVNPF